MVGIVFQTTARAVARDLNRMDIAAFFGFVPLRGGPLPKERRTEIDRAGWFKRRSNQDELRDIPVRLESLAEFETLFAADARPDRAASVRSEALPETLTIDPESALVVVEVDGSVRKTTLPPGPASRLDLKTALEGAFGDSLSFQLVESPAGSTVFLTVTRKYNGEAGSLTVYANPTIGFPVAARDVSRLVGCPLGAAVRAYFGSGGRSCYLIRMGDPLPLISTETERVRQLGLLLTGGDSFAAQATRLSQISDYSLPPVAPAAAAQDDWHGLAHLHALEDATHVLVPDLPELLSEYAPVTVDPADAERPPALFQICAEPAPARVDGAVRLMQAPRSGEGGLAVWIQTARWLGETLQRISAELIAILAVPLPAADLEGDYAGRLGGLLNGGVPRTCPLFRRVQVIYPWLRTRFADSAPGGVMAADAHLAGVIAAVTLGHGAYTTVSGWRLADVSELFPESADGLTPEAEPGHSISLVGRRPRGIQFLSDITLSSAPRFRPASVRRLFSLVLRAARHRGETAAFEPNGESLWDDVAYSLRTILRRIHAGGGLRGTTEAQAFSIACDRSTMAQADIDAGRVITEIGINPAQSVETIFIELTAEQGVALRPTVGSA